MDARLLSTAAVRGILTVLSACFKVVDWRLHNVGSILESQSSALQLAEPPAFPLSLHLHSPCCSNRRVFQSRDESLGPTGDVLLSTASVPT
eukprot:793718-Pyramimonas_sp.AAC.1